MPVHTSVPVGSIWPQLVTGRTLFDTLEDIHYNDVIMSEIASQITSLRIVYSIVYSDADQRKQQSSASLAFVRRIHRGPVNPPHKWPVTRKMFSFDDVIMNGTTILMPYLKVKSLLFIYGCPIFKWIAETWLRGLGTGIIVLVIAGGWHALLWDPSKAKISKSGKLLMISEKTPMWCAMNWKLLYLKCNDFK